MKPPIPRFKFIDLFSGIGAFHLAMSDLGGECVLASEIDDFAVETYKANFGIDSKLNIRDLDAADVPKHDVLCAGFPCQAFSVAGHGLGFADKTRGTLFFEIARILERHKTKYILLENVKQLVAHDGGKTYKTIISVLKELGYVLPKSPVVMSPLSLGVPQDRERVFIPGVHRDYTDREFLEVTVPPKQATSIDSILDDTADEKYRITEYEKRIFTAWDEFHKTLAPHFGVIWADEFGQTYDCSNDAGWRQKYCRENRRLYLDNREFIDGWMRKYDVRNFKLRDRRFEWQAGTDCKSIWETVIQLRQSGIRCKRPTNFQTLVAMVQTPIIAKLGRRLTPREAARLQSFPDTYILNGRDDKAYKQLGNSANVEVIKFLAGQLLAQG